MKTISVIYFAKIIRWKCLCFKEIERKNELDIREDLNVPTIESNKGVVIPPPQKKMMKAPHKFVSPKALHFDFDDD